MVNGHIRHFSVQMYKKFYICKSIGLKYWELSTLGIPKRSVILSVTKNLLEAGRRLRT